MIKYSFEQKKALVTAYLNGEGGILTVIKKYGYSNRSQLQRWIVAYQMYGDYGMTMVTGTVAHNVSLLARYVSPVKKSESSRKELSGFFVSLLECSRVGKRTKVRKLEPPGTIIKPPYLSSMWS